MEKHFFGAGSIKELKGILEQEGAKKILLVAEKEAYEKSGAKDAIVPLLVSFQVEEFSDILPNPTIEQVEKGIAVFRRFQPDVVLAVGGGSTIDTAKALNALAVQEGEPASYVRKERKIEKEGKPLIAVPTTAGTGAEATQFAVVYLGKTKHSLAHPFVLPVYSIVDARFTFSLPPRITASTGMDALSQAVESFWSAKSTAESKGYAREAIQLAFQSLEKAVNNPDEEVRTAMAKAAYLSGRAINIAETTACHAVSYPITSYFGVPHGHATALTLPSMILFNSGVGEEDCTDERGTEYVRKTMDELAGIMGVKDGREAKEKIEKLMDAIGLERKLEKLGVKTQENMETIVSNGFNPERVKNNPRL
ncbi:phosphonoacetaldehyde reductase, partial [Patescibacteria group bacterium]|nr:phosphonoacetaldehyde reductase [Patescibacteria group bacterium]